MNTAIKINKIINDIEKRKKSNGLKERSSGSLRYIKSEYILTEIDGEVRGIEIKWRSTSMATSGGDAYPDVEGLTAKEVNYLISTRQIRKNNYEFIKFDELNHVRQDLIKNKESA